VRRAITRDAVERLALAERCCVARLRVAPGGSFANLSDRGFVLGRLRREHGLQHLRDAVALLETKATPDEVGDYRRFILTLADKVANAHREHGQSVGDAEQRAIAEITTALGGDGG